MQFPPAPGKCTSPGPGHSVTRPTGHCSSPGRGGLKIMSSWSLGMPRPVSRTVTWRHSGSAGASPRLRRICPPAGVNLMALVVRLVSTCRMRCLSMGNGRQVRLTVTAQADPFSRRGRGQHFHHSFQPAPQRLRLELDAHFAGLQPRHIQQVVDIEAQTDRSSLWQCPNIPIGFCSADRRDRSMTMETNSRRR